MRTLVLGLLATGCTEHGTTPPDAAIKEYLDAPVTTCFAPDGSAQVTASPSFAFSRVYAGGVLLAGPVAAQKSAGAPFALKLLFTNVAQADLGILGVCDGIQTTCTTDGLAATTAGLERDAEVGTHAVLIQVTTGSRPSVQGTLTVTEFVNPFETLPGHITGSVSASGIAVSGSFSTAFCPPFLAVTI